MNRTARWWWGAALAALVASMASSSCSYKLKLNQVIGNFRPLVTISSAPIDSHVVCTPDPVQSCYSITIHWVGYDPDGRVDHYEYAVDPPVQAAAETTWIRTAGNEERLLFSSRNEVPHVRNQVYVAREFHTFVIRAVDNTYTKDLNGARGPTVSRSFFSFTEAPEVILIDPTPSSILTPVLPPSVRLTWSGSDHDGVFTTKPLKYKYTLLNPSSTFPVDLAARFPDSLRRVYAPTFVGWDSIGGDTNVVQFTNLTPNQDYMFVIVGFDEAGAYSPNFQLTTNMFRFRVGFAGSLGPQITAFNEFFNYTWRGGYCPCPTTETFIEVPADKRITVNWFAEPPDGANITSYRWAVDIIDTSDPTVRTDEGDSHDFRYWSAPGLQNTTITLGPYVGGIDPPEEHRLYIEAADNVGLKSLGIVRYQVVASSLTPGKLLIVDDTRFKPDNRDAAQPSCVARPLGPWPTAAELDTFLYARGGVTWRCYPTGTMSTPGLFSAYSFDTVGTRLQRRDLTIRLSKLGQYEFVIWLVNQEAANFSREGTDLQAPQTSLRYISGPGRFNTLAAYVKQGGKAWAVGGGCAFASTIPWNDTGNDVGGIKFSTSSTRRELVPGRFMWDLAHWQSEYREAKDGANIKRYAGRHQDTGGRPVHDPDAPYVDYLSELPSLFDFKVFGVDPFPPNRSTRGDYYQTTTDLEFLQVPNYINENTSDDPQHPNEASTLDTLYEASGGSLPRPVENPHNVVMTYYHGPAIPQGFVFTGFNFWTFKRAQCQALIDFVLRRMWNLNPTGPASFAGAERVSPQVAPVMAPMVRADGSDAANAVRRPTLRRTQAPVATGERPVAKPRN